MTDTFHITVAEARHVASMDKSGTSDPYVVLKSNFNNQTFKTKVMKKNLTPNWNQEFAFFTSKPEGQLHLIMYDKDIVYKDEFMGEVYIKLQDYADGAEVDKWIPLQNEPVAKKIDKSGGEIRLKLHWKGDPSSSSRKATTSPSTSNAASANPRPSSAQVK